MSKLLERNYSGPLYHSTYLHNLDNMIKDKFVKTSYASTESDVVKGFSKDKFLRYLSTSRSKINDYRKGMDVTLVFDGDYFNTKEFQVTPVNFKHHYKDSNVRYRGEHEERIWTNKSSISLKAVEEVHINLWKILNLRMGRLNHFDSKENKKEITNIIQSEYYRTMDQFENIFKTFPRVYVYDNEAPYEVLNKRKAMTSYETVHNYVKKRRKFAEERYLQESVINEKHYKGPLYHATHIPTLIDIFDDEHLRLGANAAILKPSRKHPDKFFYYLSTSRSKTNSYRYSNDISRTKYNALIVLDAEYYSTKNEYFIAPYDYFGGQLRGEGYDEMEERIFSKNKYMPIDGIKEVHVLADHNTKLNYKNTLKRMYRQTFPVAKERGIKIYVYDDEQPFVTLNKNKARRFRNKSSETIQEKKLLEKHYTGPLYHATTLKATADIMREGFFVLSHAGPEPESVNSYDRSETKVWGDTINKTKKKDFNFFLSASRSKLNSYRVNLSNVVDCTIVLDASFYNSLPYVHAMPVDHIAYWNKNQKRGSDTNEWLPIGSVKWDKRSEAEERIWTSQKKLTIEGVREIHFMSINEEFDDNHPIYPINDLIEMCRKHKVHLYVYVYVERDEISYDSAFKNYLYLNTKKATRVV